MEKSKMVYKKKVEEMQADGTYSEAPVQAPNYAKGPVNCLRNERIKVQFVPSPSAMIQTKGHILYGGMSENAVRTFVVPRLASTGMFKNILTDNEKEFLEQAMGLEYNALSIYRKDHNFWDDSNPQGIGKVILRKQGNYLDLSNPVDYIKYKILLAHPDKIASSLKELRDRPKATYQFVLISENAEAQENSLLIDATKRCYMEYGKIENDKDVLRAALEAFEGRTVAPNLKLDFLQGKVMEAISKDANRFLSILTDELLPAKVLIKKCVDAGILGRKNDAYYKLDDGTPLCEMGEESTLNNAAKYISSVKRSELKFSLEARLKNSK